MKAISYVFTELKTLIGAGTRGAYITLGLYGLVALIVLCTLFKGWSRGIYRQTTRLITVLASMLGSFFACAQIYPHLVTLCEGRTVGSILTRLHLDPLLAGLGIWEPVLSDVGGSTLEYMAVLPLSVFVLPALLIACFVVISLVLLIVHALVCHIFGWEHYCNTTISRVAGCVLGAVQGALVSLLVLIAVFHVTSFTGTLVKHVDEDSRLRATYETYMRTADESVLAKIVAECGGDAVGRAFANRVTIDERPVDVESMAEAAGGVLAAWETLDGADLKDLTDEQVDALRSVAHYIGEDESLAYLMAGILQSVSDTYDEYERILPFTEPFLGMLHELIAVFETTTVDTVVEDVQTLTEAYIVLMDSGVLSSQDDIARAVRLLTFRDEEGMSVLHRVVYILSQNERTAHLCRATAEYALAILSSNADADGAALYSAVAHGVRSLLDAAPANADKDEYVLAARDALRTLYESQGLHADDERLYDMATRIESTYRHIPSDDLNEEQMCDIILSYYRTYLFY